MSSPKAFSKFVNNKTRLLINTLCYFEYIFCSQSSTKLSEGGNNEESVCKDEDDDDDNDDDDKMPAGQDFDPERLKAFNVRKE